MDSKKIQTSEHNKKVAGGGARVAVGVGGSGAQTPGCQIDWLCIVREEPSQCSVTTVRGKQVFEIFFKF